MSKSLSRSLGPFVLGMTTKEFKKVTGIEPEYCPRCDDNEEYADIDDARVAKLLGSKGNKAGMDAFFFKGRLYNFGFMFEKQNNLVTIKKMQQQYGPPIKESDGSYQWRDKKTKILIHHISKDQKKFIINYYDLPLMEMHDQQEEGHSTNPGAH